MSKVNSKTWITAATSLTLLSVALGLLFNFEILDTPASYFLFAGVIFACSVGLVLVSFKASKSDNRLKKWLARAYILTFSCIAILVVSAVAIVYDRTPYFQCIHDFYFCSGEDFQTRRDKYAVLLDRQFNILDNNKNGPRLKEDLLSSLGHTYYSEAIKEKEDRKNRLLLARWFFNRYKQEVFKTSGKKTEFWDEALKDIDERLQKLNNESKNTAILKDENH